jgi:hypothetical protein
VFWIWGERCFRRLSLFCPEKNTRWEAGIPPQAARTIPLLLAERLPETIFQGGVQMKKLDMFEKDILSDYEGGEFTPPLLQKKSWKNLKLLLLPHSLKKSGSISAFPPQT